MKTGQSSGSLSLAAQISNHVRLQKLSGAPSLPGRTLCFDTSARDFSVALLDGEQLVIESSSAAETAERSGSRSLVPTIHRLLDSVGWSIGDLTRIVLPLGPGSFSGLRIGVVTAKTLGYVRQLPLHGLNTLEVIAFKAAYAEGLPNGCEVTALLDAQRGELYAQRFKINSAGLPEPTEIRHLIPESDLELRYPTGILTGSGLQLLTRPARRTPTNQAAAHRLLELAPRLAPEQYWPCDAVSAGRLAEKLGERLTAVDHWSLVPDYGRPSAAEEKAIEREIESHRGKP
jgi:tRNA threonylcarbamoyl adenosine modification protein YeaZ